MNYYKIVDKDGNLIEIVNSYNLRYSMNGKIFSCVEDKAQYVYAGGALYRIGWFNPEDPNLKGKYPIAGAILVSKEDYLNYKEKMVKVELE